jgi:hypothetical protein
MRILLLAMAGLLGLVAVSGAQEQAGPPDPWRQQAVFACLAGNELPACQRLVRQWAGGSGRRRP